jgi:hypothetical protein
LGFLEAQYHGPRALIAGISLQKTASWSVVFFCKKKDGEFITIDFFAVTATSNI